MTYISFIFYVFVLAALIAYYIVPLRFRWLVLLAGSVIFYGMACKGGCLILLITLLLTYGAGLLIDYFGKAYPHCKAKRIVMAAALLPVLVPWLFFKNGNFILGMAGVNEWGGITASLGISFYTLQIISYLVDIYKGKIEAQRNPAKYALFVLFFPQIIQGPIPRYEQLAGQLYEGHAFEERKFVKGMQLIIWGFFLKYMIADKAAVIVNTVFDYPNKYAGCYILAAGVLYSIELYTDFLACVTISQGVAGLFGITLVNNFKRPYFATSIKEFWRRWHISLSEWLRDYIYIPLGGSRKGRIVKYVNLIITFAFSGIWHGAGYKFLFWGLLHATYQVVGEIVTPARKQIYHWLALSEQSGTRKLLQRAGVFFWVMLAWIIFRADSLRTGLYMVKNLFAVYNPWIFFDDSLLNMGLDGKEWCILAISVVILLWVSYKQEAEFCIRDIILGKSVYVRWFLYIAVILCIMVFGTYGFGFRSQEFIYGGF